MESIYRHPASNKLFLLHLEWRCLRGSDQLHKPDYSFQDFHSNPWVFAIILCAVGSSCRLSCIVSDVSEWNLHHLAPCKIHHEYHLSHLEQGRRFTAVASQIFTFNKQEIGTNCICTMLLNTLANIWCHIIVADVTVCLLTGHSWRVLRAARWCCQDCPGPGFNVGPEHE